MNSKTKIVVLRLKEVLLTGLFVLLGIILVVVLVVSFLPKKEETSQPTNAVAENTLTYIPGTYSTSLILNDMTANIEVIVDENYISSVRFVELNEALKTKYPLLEPALSDIADQLIETQSMESIVYSDDMRYTATLLISAIESALKEATNIPNE
ncbi:MAG: hypothetical protein IKJ15_08770 [Lachnospiraceae bacterium]|nr:hypothetical protein [Lachnospiraceae bacterium]